MTRAKEVTKKVEDLIFTLCGNPIECDDLADRQRAICLIKNLARVLDHVEYLVKPVPKFRVCNMVWYTSAEGEAIRGTVRKVPDATHPCYDVDFIVAGRTVSRRVWEKYLRPREY